MRRLNNLERGYLAGIIDGEGCIRLKKQRAPGTRSGKSYEAKITISNSDRSFLEYVKGICGGSIQPVTSKLTKRHCWSLELSGNHVRGLLPQIIDVLIIKRKHAELLLEALPILVNRQKHRDESVEELDRICKEMQILNSGYVG